MGCTFYVARFSLFFAQGDCLEKKKSNKNSIKTSN